MKLGSLWFYWSNTDLKLTEFKIMSSSLPNVSSLANKKRWHHVIHVPVIKPKLKLQCLSWRKLPGFQLLGVCFLLHKAGRNTCKKNVHINIPVYLFTTVHTVYLFITVHTYISFYNNQYWITGMHEWIPVTLDTFSACVLVISCCMFIIRVGLNHYHKLCNSVWVT